MARARRGEAEGGGRRRGVPSLSTQTRDGEPPPATAACAAERVRLPPPPSYARVSIQDQAKEKGVEAKPSLSSEPEASSCTHRKEGGYCKALQQAYVTPYSYAPSVVRLPPAADYPQQ